MPSACLDRRSDARGAVNAALAIPQGLSGGGTSIALQPNASRLTIDNGGSVRRLELIANDTASQMIRLVTVETEVAAAVQSEFPGVTIDTALSLAGSNVTSLTESSLMDANVFELPLDEAQHQQ